MQQILGTDTAPGLYDEHYQKEPTTNCAHEVPLHLYKSYSHPQPWVVEKEEMDFFENYKLVFCFLLYLTVQFLAELLEQPSSATSLSFRSVALFLPNLEILGKFEMAAISLFFDTIFWLKNLICAFVPKILWYNVI